MAIDADLLRPEAELGGVPRTDNFAGVEGAEAVPTFEWGGEEVEVLYDGSLYTALLPVMTIEGEPERFFSGQYLMRVRVQHSVNEPEFGDIVLDIFEGFESHECMAEMWESTIPNVTVEVES